MRKAKTKSKEPAEKSARKFAKKSKPISKKPVDMTRVRADILNMVGNSAMRIATEVINAAMSGELARAKYLFEIVGVYPAREETANANPREDSLAYTLLKKMGLPIEPAIADEDSGTALLTEDTADESELQPAGTTK